MRELDDKILLIDVLKFVKIEKQTTARILEYLSEIDFRKLWVKEGYSSMHDFCTRYLKYSEGEANRRIQAARITQEVVALKPLLENNELSLTALSVIAPYVNEDNVMELIPKIKYQPVREIEKILYETFPEARRK